METRDEIIQHLGDCGDFYREEMPKFYRESVSMELASLGKFGYKPPGEEETWMCVVLFEPDLKALEVTLERCFAQ